MNVRVRVRFDPVTEQDRKEMRSLAAGLTDDRSSVRVVADEEPGWLAAEFTMPTEAQTKAVDKIDKSLRYGVENRQDSTIGFPKTAAEKEHGRGKNERRKANRKAT